MHIYIHVSYLQGSDFGTNPKNTPSAEYTRSPFYLPRLGNILPGCLLSNHNHMKITVCEMQSSDILREVPFLHSSP
jgi:hypothetical protein